MVTGKRVTVSRLAADETAARQRLVDLASQAFPAPQHYFVALSEHTLVARSEGEIVGGVVFKLVDGDPGPVALAAWGYVDPSTQGEGVGSTLVTEGLSYLQERGCRAVVGSVRWSNTPSSKLLARTGFSRLSTTTLLGRLGLAQGTRLLIRAYHPVNLGCNLWYRALDDTSGSESDQETVGSGPRRGALGRVTATLAVHVLLVAVAVGGFAPWTWGESTLVLAAAGAGLVALRWLPTAVLTARDDCGWAFWAWENVYPAAGLAALLGVLLFVPGHVAETRRDWSYWSRLDTLGPAAAASGAMLVGALAGATLAQDALGSAYWPALRGLLTAVLVVDLLFVPWPFDRYNGRVIYDWNRVVWAVLALAGVATIAAAYLV